MVFQGESVVLCGQRRPGLSMHVVFVFRLVTQAPYMAAEDVTMSMNGEEEEVDRMRCVFIVCIADSTFTEAVTSVDGVETQVAEKATVFQTLVNLQPQHNATAAATRARVPERVVRYVIDVRRRPRSFNADVR